MDGGDSLDAERSGAEIGRLGVESVDTVSESLEDPFQEFFHLVGNMEPARETLRDDILATETVEGSPLLADASTGGGDLKNAEVAGHLVSAVQRYRLDLKEDTILGPSESRFVKLEAGGLDRCGLMLEGKFVANPGKEWVAPRCLVNVKRGVCETLITNLSSRPLILRKSKLKFHAFSVKSSRGGSQLATLWETEEGGHQSNNAPGRKICCVSQGSPFKLGEGLSDSEKARMVDLLSEFDYCFHPAELKAERAKGFTHCIDTGDSHPIRTNPRRVAPAERLIVREQVLEMLNAGVIEPSSSPWSSPVVLVRKKDNSVRFCIDYRKLNRITRKDVYPLPRIDDVLDSLAGSSVFSILDLYKGYWQVPVREDDKEKTAFVTPDGLFQFRQMPFGLCNAPASFQRLMDTVLAPLKWLTCLVYMDDIIIFSAGFEEHLVRLRAVLEAIAEAGLILNPVKCLFATESATYLGHRVSGEGVGPDPEKTKAIVHFPPPCCVTTVRRFIGMASYYRRFVKDFSKIAGPLFELTKQGIKFKWTESERTAFEDLKNRLLSSPILAHVDFEAKLILRTDASLEGLGAVLSQKKDGSETVLHYLSKRLGDQEKKWHPNDLECLAVFWAVTTLRPFLYGRSCRVLTDNMVAATFKNQANLVGKYARWAMAVNEFEGLTTEHCPGVSNCVADALSRAPFVESGGDAILCGDCSKKSKKAGVIERSEPKRMCVIAKKDQYFSPEELALVQWEDVGLRPLIIHFSPPNLFQDPTAFKMINGILYKRNLNAGKHWLLAVPKGLCYDVIRACHSDPLGGHEGVAKTVSRIQQRFWWTGLKNHVATFIRGCTFCQKRKTPRALPIGLLNPIPVPNKPFQQWGIDHVGPLPRSYSGRLYMLVAVDYFSKFTVAKAVMDAKADTAVRFFKDRIVSQFGIPNRIISDRGSAFISNLWKEEMTKLGVHHALCTTEHAQSNGLTEKVNGVLIDRLAAFANEHPEHWDRHLPPAMACLNTGVQVSTKFSPFQIIFGFCPTLPIENRFPWPEEEWKADIERDAIWRDARANIERAQAKQKMFYDKRHRATPIFLPGELVLVRRIQQPAAGPKKFRPRYIGPFVIVCALSDTTYQVEDLPMNRTRKNWSVFPAHVAQIKRFFAPVTAGQLAAEQPDPLPTLEEDEVDDHPPLSPSTVITVEEEEELLPVVPAGADAEVYPRPPITLTVAEVPAAVEPGSRTRRRPAWWNDYVVETKVRYD